MDGTHSPQEPEVRFSPPERPECRIFHGNYARLEPIDAVRHTPELFAAASHAGGDQSWAYLPCGPFETEEQMGARVQEWQTSKDQVFFAIRDLDTGAACGVASFMRINQAMGVIEIGHIWMAPRLQRTRAATEAIFTMMDHALTDLGYRRLEWKCNAANAASRSAAERFGFSYEGTFRQHMVVKGRNRDTAWFSILDAEWPDLRRMFVNWLDLENFGPDKSQIRRLKDCG